MIESTCPRCGAKHFAPVPVTQFACCPSSYHEILDNSLKQVIRHQSKQKSDQLPPPRPNTSNEPGSVLYRILKDVFGIKPKQNCGCNRLRNEMDFLGIDGCQQQFDRLAESLKANAKAYNWLESFSAAINAIRSGALQWLDPFHPWESILRHAIESSRQLKVKDADLDDTKD